MFNRIRASIVGEPDASSPDKSPRPPSRNSRHGSRTPPPQQQRQGFGFFGGNLPVNGSTRTLGSDRNSLAGSTSSGPPQERGFFGGLLPQAASPKPSPTVEASPGSIRASAAALLKLATPPLSDDRYHPEINPNSSLNDGIDDVDLAQRDTLEYQINRRDTYISRLQGDLHKMQSQLGQYTKDNNTLRRQHLESTHRHSIAIKLWRRTNDGLGARVECFENETTPAAAREIANLIRDAAPPNKDSAYLMMLQDQLTKATVKLDHLGSQTEIVLHKGEEVVESLREEMNEVIRERCRMELELLDQERMLEDDMKRMVLKTERRLKRVQGEIDFLEKNAVEVLKSQEEEGDSGDDEDDADRKNEDDGPNDGKDNGEETTNTTGDKTDEGEESDGDESGSDSDSSEEANDKQSESATGREDPSGVEPSKKPSNGNTKQPEHTPEILRKELRKVAIDRDRSLNVMQKKLREKNDEFHALMRLKEQRTKNIREMEREKRDREEWERSRQEGLLP